MTPGLAGFDAHVLLYVAVNAATSLVLPQAPLKGEQVENRDFHFFEGER